MTTRDNTKNISLSNGLAEWGVVIASLAFVFGVVVATVRLAPAQIAATQAPALEKPSMDADKPSPSLPSTGETLSERLEKSDGVIRPPGGVDPEIAVMPKDPGAGANMPVIRPPGPGGEGVRPK